MDSSGKLFKKGEFKAQAEIFRAYEKLCETGFEQFESFTDSELDRFQQIHDKRLDFYREERRMHFGAFALVSLAFVILFPPLLSAENHFLPLLGIEALLFCLLVPYTFVYRRYEEGVRRMMRESILLENARSKKKQTLAR